MRLNALYTSTNLMSRKGLSLFPLLTIAALIAVGPAMIFARPASAQAASQTGSQTDGGEGLSLQVSPSPLIATVKPGAITTLELRIRNTSSTAQALKMGLQSFTIDEASGKIELQKTVPADVTKAITFDSPTFTVKPGEIYTQHVVANVPGNAGFTYSFATTISQQNPPKADVGKTSITGKVAVFTLLSVDKPGAVRKLDLSQFSVGKRVYEYLPAEIKLRFKNSGNTLAQPKGTIYIQRHSNDTTPVATIQLNQSGGFILPGTSRELTSSWNGGFPHYETVTDPGGDANKAPKQKLVWHGSDISKIRIGKYVAKIVAVYDDGKRDVPLTAEVTFWVIPWRILLGLLLIVVLLLIGLVTILRKSTKALKPLKSSKRKSARTDRTDDAPPGS